MSEAASAPVDEWATDDDSSTPAPEIDPEDFGTLNIDELEELVDQERDKLKAADDGYTLTAEGREDVRRMHAMMDRIEELATWKAKYEANVAWRSWSGMCSSVEDDDVHDDDEVRQFILDPLLSPSETIMIHAARGVGKTWFGLLLARAVALGEPFLKWKCRAGRVLYLDGEMTAYGLADRLNMMTLESERDLLGSQVDIVRGQSTYRPFDLSDPACRDELRGFLFRPNDGGPMVRLLILDSLSTLARRHDQIDPQDWQPIAEWLSGLKQEGISTLLFHHSGKSGEQRGTTEREDFVDHIIKLTRPDDYRMSDGCRFNVVFEKSRRLFGADLESFEARLVGNGSRIAFQIDEIPQAKARQLQENGMSIRQISEELGISKSSVERMLTR